MNDLSQKLSREHTEIDTQYSVVSHAPAYSQVSSPESPSMEIDDKLVEYEVTEDDNKSWTQDLHEDLTSSLQQGPTSTEITSQTTNQSDQVCRLAQNSQPDKVQDSRHFSQISTA